MKSSQEGRATLLGLVLFGLAAVLLIGVIATARLGQLHIANTLTQIAGPISAMAIAALAQLALHKPKADTEA